MKKKANIFFNFKCIITVCVLLLSFSAEAQDVKATAKLDSAVISIGQQAAVQLTVEYRADNGKHITIGWPEISDTLRKEVEVLGQTKTDTVINKNDPYLFTLTRTIYVTSFDSGYWAIPPFRFNVNNDTNGVFTEPLLLQVNTVPVDTTAAIKDVKPPYEETYTFMDWLKDNMYVVYGLAGLIALIIVIIIVVRKLKKAKPPVVVVEAPKIPAHVIALEKLEKIKAAKLWQEGKLKQYYSALTDVGREYLENRFKIQAMEQTTEEILYSLRNVAVDEESKSKLKQVLILSDLVKFAKEQPLAHENEMSLNNTFDFINGTKREEEYKAENKQKKVDPASTSNN